MRKLFLTIFTVLLLCLLPTSAKAYNYANNPGLDNNGTSREASYNGLYMTEGNWGSYSIIWDHKKGANMAGSAETFYYAKERGISLPEAISIESDLEVSIFAAGYAHYFYGDDYDFDPVNVNVEFYLQDINQWVVAGNYNLTGYNSFPRNSLPYYKDTLNIHLNASNWNSHPILKGHSLKAIRMYVTNTFAGRPLKDTDIYCIDDMKVSVFCPDNPVIENPGVHSERYYESKRDVHWYRRDDKIDISYETLDELLPINANTLRLISTTNKDLSLYMVQLDMNCSVDDWLDTTSSFYDGSIMVRGDDRHKYNSFYVRGKMDSIYEVYAGARNNHNRWQLPSKREDIPKDLDIRVGIDGVAPTLNLYASGVNLNNFTMNMKNITDELGSGQKEIKIKTYPKNYDKPDSVLWLSNINVLDKTQVSRSLSYPKQFDELFGVFTVQVQICDNVGNIRNYYYDINRIDPTPECAVIDLQNIKYPEPGTHNKWVNCRDSFFVTQWARNNITVSKYLGYPSGIETHFEDSKYQTLYFKQGLSKNKYFNDNKNGFTCITNRTIKEVVNDKKHLKLNTTLRANSVYHGASMSLKTMGYTTYKNTDFKTNWVYEKDGDILCIDGKAPEITYKRLTRNSIMLEVSDYNSGIYTITAKDSNGNTVLSSKFSKTDKRVTNTQIPIKDLSSPTLDITVSDNVDNVKTYHLKDLIPVINTNITINDVPLPDNPPTPGSKDCQDLMSKIGVKGVLKDSRKELKVSVTAEIISGAFPDYVPRFRLTGTGAEVPAVNGVMDEKERKLSGDYYIDDTYNTPEEPNVKYSTSSSEAKLTWDSMVDPLRPYSFNIMSKLSQNEDWYLEATTNPLVIEFASGYNDFDFKLWSVSGNGIMPTTSPLIEKKEDFTSLDMSFYPSGWYYLECTMYDFNKNPSGTRKMWFYHEQPSLYQVISVDVTAVKDIDWEGETYPLVYGYGTQLEGHKTNLTGGKDFSKFPLGKDYKFNGKDIAQGYSINYNICKERAGNLSALEVRYDLYSESGQKLIAKIDDKNLETLDLTKGTNFCSYKLNSSELSQINSSNTKVYLKHFIPTNATIYTKGGDVYDGYVTVEVRFISLVDDLTATRGMQLYTFNTNEKAIDDLTGDKQR